jgi:Flp pilus assembly protein TadG
MPAPPMFHVEHRPRLDSRSRSHGRMHSRLRACRRSAEGWRECHNEMTPYLACRLRGLGYQRMQRGQGLVEFLLFVTILLVLLAGVYDLGSLLNGHLAVTYAARQGALSAASAGTNAAADCDALAAIALGVGQQPGVSVTRIAIYEPGSDGLPLGGLGSSAYADVYNGDPGCANPASMPAAQATNWPPADRVAGYAPPTMLGVEIDYTYSWQSNLISLGAISISDHAVVPITPG